MHPLLRHVETTVLTQHFDEDLCEDFPFFLYLPLCLYESESNGKNKMKIQFQPKISCLKHNEHQF